MATKQGPCHSDRNELNTIMFILSSRRKPIKAVLILFIYFLNASGNSSRLHAYPQQVQFVPIVQEPHQTIIEEPMSLMTLNHQLLAFDPYPAAFDTDLVSSRDRSIIHETQLLNWSLPKNESLATSKPNRESKSWNILPDSKLELKNSSKLASAESNNIAIAIKTTNNKHENNKNIQQRHRRASATKLKNLKPVSVNETILTLRYQPIASVSKPSEVKVDITKRLNLVSDSTSPSPSIAKTMVLVTTRSRKFSELVPLDELIVAPTNIQPGLNLIRPLIERRPLDQVPQNDPISYGSSSSSDFPTSTQFNPIPMKQEQIFSSDPNIEPDDDDEDDDGSFGLGTNPVDLVEQKHNNQKQNLHPQMIQQRQLLPSNVKSAMDRRESLQPLPNPSDDVESQSYIRDTKQDLIVAAGHYYKKKKPKHKKKKPKKKKHHHGHSKYYMYAKVPKKKAWEFGYKRGNKKHKIERHEKGHKSKFYTKVKWADKKSKGKGIHIWDYNHHDKKKKKHY